ncbi:MAG: GntR family transcriptional regulator [Rubrivivax sp.]|jgi:DNA-binding GntR family transcriptional regulator|nr:GntR family transcriptional regulator [Rubrivivax sp.]
MTLHEDPELFDRLAGPMALRMFGDATDLTLTVPEQIAAKVGDRIIAGLLAPGARIGEQELADEYKLSRGPVREAIRILEREGLATIQARRGAFVTQLSARELQELFEIRAGLFDIVVRRVAAQRPPELLAALRAGVARLQLLAPLADGGEAYAETTCRLILVAARYAGNERLQRLIRALALQTLRYSKLGLASVERRQRSVQLWVQSVQALERGDEQALSLLSRQRSDESAREAALQLAGHVPIA